MKLKEIGIIRSPYKRREDAPRQGKFSDEVSILKVHEKYSPGLAGIGQFDHLIVLYWAGKASREVLKSCRHEDKGVFATRSPARPNPINFCVCQVVSVNRMQIKVKGLDAVDGSSLLDLKPYLLDLDCPFDHD